jgi:hypothetical protein
VETGPLFRRFVYSNRLIHHEYPMGIFRALGFGLFLIIMALLLPAVFSELATTLVIFLQSSQKAFLAAGTIASYAGQITPPLH